MITSLFYNNLTVLDYAFLTGDGRIVGNSLRVNAVLKGEVNEEGVIYDFATVKRRIKQLVDQECDHRLMVLTSQVQKRDSQYLLAIGELEYFAPIDAFCLLQENSPKGICKYLEKIILSQMPENISFVEIQLQEENEKDNNYYFHYTHGLKQHAGNCQRLFHGHRSTIKIYRNGVRDIALEKYFVEEIVRGSVHFVCLDDVFCEDNSTISIRYCGGQGQFSARLPKDQVYVVDSETTIENLASHFGQKILQLVEQKDQIEVVAFEGIDKGASISILPPL